MEFEDELLNLLLKSPNSQSIQTIAEQLKIINNFTLANIEMIYRVFGSLGGVVLIVLFKNILLLLITLKFLLPFNLNGLNLLKPRGIKSIIGTGILIRLYYINEKKIGVKFTHAGVIGPKFGRKNIKAMKEINNEQLGWLEITYLSNKLRICRGDKGTLFVLRK